MPTNPSTQRSLLIIWLCGIALVSVFTVKAVKKAHQIEKLGISWEKLEEINNLDQNDIDDIKISPDGITIKTTNGTQYDIKRGKVKMENIENESIQTTDSILTSDSSATTEIIEEKSSLNSDSINFQAQ